MYVLTKSGTLESGAYASIDMEGNIVVNFFEDKDDADSYNIQLEAIDQELVVTETPNEGIDKLCNLMGYAYTIIKPGQVVVPRAETIEYEEL